MVRAVIGFILFIAIQSQAAGLDCRYLYDGQNLQLTTQILTQPKGSQSEQLLLSVQKNLGLDEINFKYLRVLLNAYVESKASNKSDSVIVIADHHNLAEALGKTTMVVPTAIASKKLMKSVPVTEYASILEKKSDYEAVTSKVRFWVKKLMAGTGSGIVRVEFLKGIYEKLGKSGPIKIGSKGTDLHAEVVIDGKTHYLSIAELQILQLLAQSDKYKQVIFHDVVSNETLNSIQATWKNANSLLGGKSLSSVAEEKGEVRATPTVQYHIPTINEAGHLSRERMAPAGHGLFAIEAILAMLNNKLPKSKKTEPLVGVIGNGEDLMSTPSPEIVGWMAKEQLPLVMVTTEKTDLDKQGGQIAIGFNSKGQEYVTIVEKAQAEGAVKKGFVDQMDLFSKLGLRPKDNKAMFNTNMVLINYKVLQPKILLLAEKVGGNEKLLELVAPDLIPNTKEQKDADGLKKLFTQLEGAMGSVVLKLDRLHRETFNGEPLVHFLNIGKEHRTQFFAPIKSGFDFFMQFYSDRFSVDGNAFKIVDKRPGFNPKVTLSNEFYKEAANVLSAFKDTKILDLDELAVDGVVSFAGLKLSGIVRVKNESGLPVHLPTIVEGSELKNVEIQITKDGFVVKPL